jgi:MauM/NapG family ferredoxin protein
MTRREFFQIGRRTMVGGTAAASGLTLLGISLRRQPAPKSQRSEPTVLRPPGAMEETPFLARCIRCQRCQDACPRGAIRLAGPGDPAQSGTPFILPADTACNLCLACTQTCPTEALKPVSKKEDVRMGVAVVDPRTCVSINRSGICGACHTACPLKNKAITLGLRNAPVVHEDACVGCGLCVEACIVKGIRAIRVFSGRPLS